MKFPLYAAVPAAAVVLAGCSDPLSFQDLAGSYPLAEVNTKRLPVLLTATATCDQWIEQGQLTLESSGQFMLTLGGHFDCNGSGQINGWDFPGTYTISDDSLHFVSNGDPYVTYVFNGVVFARHTRIQIVDLPVQLDVPLFLEFRRQ